MKTKTSLNFDTEIEYNNETYSIRNNKLYLGKQRITHTTNARLSNHIVKIYLAVLVACTKKIAFPKGIKFDLLVENIRYLIATRDFILNVRSWSCGGSSRYSFRRGGRSTMEVFSDEMRNILYDIFDYHLTGNQNTPQNIVLDMVSDGYAGCTPSNSYDIYDHFNPKTLSTKGLEKELKLIKGFNFAKYGIKKTEVVKSYKVLHDEVITMSDNFKKIVAIAGNDFINWGPHKIAAQCKKHDIERSFGYDWQDLYCDGLKKKGVKPAKPVEKKISKAENLIDRWRDDKHSVSQDDLITIFKNLNERCCGNAIDAMDVQTATSLLTMETKNVKDKIATYSKYNEEWHTTEVFNKIYDLVASKENEDAYNALTSFMQDKEIKHITWQFIETYSNHYFTFGDYDLTRLEFHEISDEVFDRCFDDETSGNRFKTNSSITHKYLERMDTDEKSMVLYSFTQNDDWDINWKYSAKLLKGVDYKYIKPLITRNNHEYFMSYTTAENDTETAATILEDCNHSNPDSDEIRLYQMLEFDKRMELTANRRWLDGSDIKAIVGKDSEKFKKYAIQCHLTSHLTKTFKVTKSELNSLISNAPYPVVSVSDIGYLTQENTLKVFEHGEWKNHTTGYHYHRNRETVCDEVAYQHLTRKSFLKLTDMTPNEHHMRNHLHGIMTVDEYIECCSFDDFVRHNIDIISQDIVTVKLLERFSDKARFKSIVGDKRKPENLKFANKLTEALKRISKPSLRLVNSK